MDYHIIMNITFFVLGCLVGSTVVWKASKRTIKRMVERLKEIDNRASKAAAHYNEDIKRLEKQVNTIQDFINKKTGS